MLRFKPNVRILPSLRLSRLAVSRSANCENPSRRSHLLPFFVGLARWTFTLA